MKKKLLAFLLAVIMVAAMVCSTAVSVIAATEPASSGAESSVPSTQSSSGDDKQGNEPAVEYPAVDRAVAVAELLDENGNFLANLAALNATALGYVKDGYTIRLLKDITASTALTISTPGVRWTLDAMKEDGTAAVYAYTGAGYALVIGGAGQHLTIKGLKLNSAKSGIQAGADAASTSLVLENVQIRCDNATATSSTSGRRTDSIALFNAGTKSFVKITGADTVMHTLGSTRGGGGDTIKNTGYVEIYDGYFYAQATLNGIVNTTGDGAKASIFGGTFVGGPGTKSTVRVSGGATLLVAGGAFYANYANAANSAASVVSFSTDGGYAYITGGTFYSARANTPIFAYGDNEDKAYVNISGGTFYANMNLDTKNAPLSDTFTIDVPFKGQTKYYGVEINDLYKVTTEVLADDAATEGVVENQFTAAVLGIPAGEYATTLDSVATFTLICKETVGYNAEHDAYLNGTKTFEVTNLYTGTTKNYFASEMDLAFLSLADGGTIALLCDVSLDKALNTTNYPADFEWTLTSAGGRACTLTITVQATNADAKSKVTTGYVFYLNGSTLNLENISIINPKGGVLVVDSNSTLNLKKGAEILVHTVDHVDGGAVKTAAAKIATNAICVASGNVNVYAGAYIYPPNINSGTISLIRLFGPSVLTIHEGAKVGYNKNGNVPEQSGCYVIWISHKDAVVHCYGEVATDKGRAVQGRDQGKVDGEGVSGGTLYIYDGAKFSAKSSGAGVITCYDTTVYVYGGDFYQPSSSGAEVSIFMVVPDGSNKTNIYIKGGTFHDSVSSNGRMIMSRASSYVEITGGTFYGVSHSLIMTKDLAPHVVIKNGVDEDGNVISVPHLYGPNGKPIIDLRQDSTCEISGGYFWANYSGPLLQMYAAGLTVTGGEFYNLTGNMIAITEQGGDASKNLKINDVYIDGANCIFQYKNRFLDVNNESGDVNAAGTNSPGMRTITVKNVTISGASHFLYMKSCLANVIFENVTATTTDGEGTWITSGKGSITFTNCHLTAERGALLYFPASDATAYHVTINGGTYQSPTYVIRNLARSMADASGNVAGITINGGTFKSYNNKPLVACVSIEAGICTINGGNFISNGACVVYVGGGEVNTYLDRIYKASTAKLTVNDGYFVLSENGRGLATDAVLKCGNETAYAKVTLNGGVFVSNREGCEQLVAKNNEFCTLTVVTPVLMANPDADNYITAIDPTKDTVPNAVDGVLAVDPATHPTVMNGEDVKYYVLAYAAPELSTIGADLEILLSDTGLGYKGYTDAALESEMGDVLTGGVLIATKADVEAAGELTFKALEEAGKSYTVITEADIENFVSIDGNTFANFAVAVANYDTEYYFVGFSKLTVGGVDYYIYNVAIDKAVSVRATAQAALDDVQNEACVIGDVSYQYTSIIDENKFSPYTTEEQTALKAIVEAQVATPNT